MRALIPDPDLMTTPFKVEVLLGHIKLESRFVVTPRGYKYQNRSFVVEADGRETIGEWADGVEVTHG